MTGGSLEEEEPFHGLLGPLPCFVWAKANNARLALQQRRKMTLQISQSQPFFSLFFKLACSKTKNAYVDARRENISFFSRVRCPSSFFFAAAAALTHLFVLLLTQRPICQPHVKSRSFPLFSFQRRRRSKFERVKGQKSTLVLCTHKMSKRSGASKKKRVLLAAYLRNV